MYLISNLITSPGCKTLKILLSALLIFMLQFASAQNKFETLGNKIDSLSAIGMPKSALAEVDKLDAVARADKNIPQQIRAVIYRMLFQSYLEQDALTEVINGLKTDISRSEFPVKPVLQSLLAEIYWKYYEQNRYQFNQRSRLTTPGDDFTLWDLQTIVAETNNLYRLSLTHIKLEQNTPVNILEGVLQGDPSTRYLRPTLYDLLVQRALDHYLTAEPELIKPRLPFTLNDPALFGSSKEFAQLKINTTDTASAYYLGIKYLLQVTAFHLNNNDTEALADIDMQRLKFLHDKAIVADKDSLYLAALAQIADTFAAKPISSEALVLQGQYYQALDSLQKAYRFFKKAAASYPVSMGGKNASTLIQQLETKALSAVVENVNIPGKPVLALLKYRNVSAARIVVYQLSGSQLKEYSSIKISEGYADRNFYQLNYLKKLIPVQTKHFKWARTSDYLEHSSEINIDALTPGNYVLLLNDDSTDDEKLASITEFDISGLAYTSRLNPDDQMELRVVNRETGSPIASASVKLAGRYWGRKKDTQVATWIDTVQTGVTDKDGLYATEKMLNDNVAVTLAFRSDTLTDPLNYVYGARDNSDDNEPEDKTILFTDRQIYRPGQTIYFKGLQLEVIKGKSKIMPGEEVEIEFSDVNSKTVSSLILKTNEFGTFSGSFIIPQTMLAGNVKLETIDGGISVRVEEYKRPTFEAQFLPVKESYKLNDSVTVKGNVKAFSGYGLSDAKVAYHIVRTQNTIYLNEVQRRAVYGSRYVRPEVTEIKNDTVKTNEQGDFEIKFKAILGEKNKTVTANYTYTINADVTDASGETRPAQTFVTIGNNDIVINDGIPQQFFARDTLKAVISINNLNGQPLKATVKVEVYSLQNAKRIFKKRLWPVPDQFILDSSIFKNSFPEYAYKQDDVFSNWKIKQQIVSMNINVDGRNSAIINLESLKKHPSGVYKFVIHARNLKGDTTSITKYIDYIDKPAMPGNIDNWVIPVVNAVRPGDNAEFLVGIDQKINVLMERYNGSKLISSKWIIVKKGQQSIKVPVSANDRNVAVQFLMVHQNRLYTSYQKIIVQNDDASLKLKLLTFRDKLAPGQKEQWKLQISNKNNEGQMAEMLAGLYDGSLDDITSPENWQTALSGPDNYTPNYFAWNGYDFVSAASTVPMHYTRTAAALLARDYETLDMLDYSYYGGYNYGYRTYLEKTKQRLSVLENDKQIEKTYLKNAARIKNGYVITGKVIEEGGELPGVFITIKGTGIGTTSNSKGFFKIKVPLNGVLVFTFVGYEKKEIQTTKEENVVVSLVANMQALNEVVVMGYGTQKKQSLTGSVSTISIRGISSLNGYNSFDTSEVLQGRVAGVMITEGAPGAADKITMREINVKRDEAFNKENRIISFRKNFNETAFFYPQLHTDSKGQILIEFSIPEALTRWKFRALAHTKQLNTGYIEADVVTQKQLSINANMPRFFREGDTITVSARLANLTSDVLRGKVIIQLFNAVTMQPVSLLQNSEDAEQAFEVNALANKAISFKLIIPQELDALTYRLSAEAGQYTDGEENTVPVLPNRMLVTEAMPMMVRAGQSRNFTFDKLLNHTSPTLKNKTLTLEYTQNPAWYVVQALPYMMEFPHECSEQLFNRYFANSLASKLVNGMPVIKEVLDRWKSSSSVELLSNLEKNQELKYTLLEETPWLRDAAGEAEQKKRLALLFDLNKMSSELQLNADKLIRKQLPNGGFPWFGGDRADRYITQHIIAGIGQLYRLNITGDELLQSIGDKAINFLDNALIDDEQKARRIKSYATRDINSTEIHAWYARSFFTNKPISATLKAVFNNYIQRAKKQWILQNVYEQGMVALTMQRSGNIALSTAIIKSLKETARQSDELGMYWPKNERGYYWYQSPVETQCLMIALFSEAGKNAKAVEEMKIWLLRNKQTNNWKTTTATAAACYALLNKQNGWLAESNSSDIKLNYMPLTELKPDVKAENGTGYIKAKWTNEQIKPAFGQVEVSNKGNSVSWGAMYWQYMEQLDKITPSKTDIQLERKYFIVRQTDTGPVATPVDFEHQPKTGDLLKVIVYLKAGRDFEYVQLKDMRPAGTEPVATLSEYKYQDGLYYYQVTKDVATNFFISYLNKGNYVFEYQLRVAQPGNFSTGIATVQCMYAPEFNAHSEGIRMKVKP